MNSNTAEAGALECKVCWPTPSDGPGDRLYVIWMHCIFHIVFLLLIFPQKSIFDHVIYLFLILFVFNLISVFYLYSDRTSFKIEYG